MDLTLDQLEIEAAKLSPVERHALIERLRDLDEPVNAAVEAEWDAVIERRAQEILDGTAKTVELHDFIETRRKIR